jgi:hypothetical protein
MYELDKQAVLLGKIESFQLGQNLFVIGNQKSIGAWDVSSFPSLCSTESSTNLSW